jgi:hypothetical protein
VGLDGGQREAQRRQLADQFQARDVVGAVQAGAPAQLRGLQQPASGVEAEGAHGDAGAFRELVDGEEIG